MKTVKGREFVSGVWTWLILYLIRIWLCDPKSSFLYSGPLTEFPERLSRRSLTFQSKRYKAMFELRRTMSNLVPKENILTLLFHLITENIQEKKDILGNILGMETSLGEQTIQPKLRCLNLNDSKGIRIIVSFYHFAYFLKWNLAFLNCTWNNY